MMTYRASISANEIHKSSPMPRTKQKSPEERLHSCTKIQMDKIWEFVVKKQKSASKADKRKGVGDVWTFVAVDAQIRMVAMFLSLGVIPITRILLSKTWRPG